MITAGNNNVIKTGGRLGNACMRVMSLMGISKQYNVDFAIPKWKYRPYFENNIPEKDLLYYSTTIKEPYFHYCPNLLEGVDLNLEIINLEGFFQSKKYWPERLVFKKEYLDWLRTKYDFSKRPIAASVRRGDFVGNKNYLQLPDSYYMEGIMQNFPDYKDRQIFFFSDEINYCKNFWFSNRVLVDAEDIEQLGVMSLCEDFLLSNSTFSFMGAYLANRGKVVRPIRNFDGDLAKRNSEKDYWPESWVIFDHTKIKNDVDTIR